MIKKPESNVSIKVASSPDRHTFQREGYLKRCEEKGQEPNQAYLEMWDKVKQQDVEWHQQQHVNDLEYDLRSTDWIVAKARASESYAQNIYAALCNMEWQRADVWPVLKDERWSCSWRSAGGIVADIRGEGDYIDWYCSGMRNTTIGDDESKHWADRNYVSEGTVTDEIREDFARLGWRPVPYHDE